MATVGRTLAWANLAWRFGTHVLLRLPARALGRDSGSQRFRDAVMPEGYVPLTAAEREMFPRTMSCIQCGLCALACQDAAAQPMSAWDEPWTFVAGPSRSLDRAVIAAAGLTACADEPSAAAVCPMGIPIPDMAAMMRRMATDPVSA